MAKLIHYRQKCIGCGVCQEMQPEIWRMSKKDGKAVLLQAQLKKDISILLIHSSQVPLSAETATACPVNIIKVV
jgi:ferredoxin